MPGPSRNVRRCWISTARHFAINCPIDLHLRLNMAGGGLDIINVLAEKSPIRSNALQQWIVFQPRHEWRHPQRPVLQMLTAYVFVSDDPVYINQYPRILHFSSDTRPGHSDQRPLPHRYLAARADVGI